MNPDFIIIEGDDEPRTKYVTLAGPDELDLNDGRQFVRSVLCMNYADGTTLEN